jgi:hypothetical protein
LPGSFLLRCMYNNNTFLVFGVALCLTCCKRFFRECILTMSHMYCSFWDYDDTFCVFTLFTSVGLLVVDY